MKANEFRKKDVAELQEEVANLAREQFNLKMQRATRQLTQTHHLRNVRRNIARAKTILQEKTG